RVVVLPEARIPGARRGRAATHARRARAHPPRSQAPLEPGYTADPGGRERLLDRRPEAGRRDRGLPAGLGRAGRHGPPRAALRVGPRARRADLRRGGRAPPRAPRMAPAATSRAPG